MITIGDAMREARVSHGLTQTELSKLSGICQSAISEYECGIRIPCILNLWSIADALGVGIDMLVGRCRS